MSPNLMDSINDVETGSLPPAYSESSQQNTSEDTLKQRKLDLDERERKLRNKEEDFEKAAVRARVDGSFLSLLDGVCFVQGVIASMFIGKTVGKATFTLDTRLGMAAYILAVAGWLRFDQWLVSTPLLENLELHRRKKWMFRFLTILWHLRATIAALILALYVTALGAYHLRLALQHAESL